MCARSLRIKSLIAELLLGLQREYACCGYR
jgi:hypothetical protein